MVGCGNLQRVHKSSQGNKKSESIQVCPIKPKSTGQTCTPAAQRADHNHDNVAGAAPIVNPLFFSRYTLISSF